MEISVIAMSKKVGDDIKMKWEEIRSRYPNQFVLIKIIEDHMEDRNGDMYNVVDRFEFVKPLITQEEIKEGFKAVSPYSICSTRFSKIEFKTTYNFTVFKVGKKDK